MFSIASGSLEPGGVGQTHHFGMASRISWEEAAESLWATKVVWSRAEMPIAWETIATASAVSLEHVLRAKDQQNGSKGQERCHAQISGWLTSLDKNGTGRRGEFMNLISIYPKETNYALEVTAMLLGNQMKFFTTKTKGTWERNVIQL